MIHKIVLEFSPGTELHRAAEESLEIVKLTHIPVEFKFNGIKLEVNSLTAIQHDAVQQIVGDWEWAVLRERRAVERA
jgi:hypothetical protein